MTTTTQTLRAPRRVLPKRMFLTDARFFVGIALIVVSVIGVWLVVSSARSVEPVLAADTTIVPGQAVTADDLAVVEVALGSADGAYLAPSQLEEGFVATRTILAGELVPTSSVATAAASTTTSVVVRSAIEVPESLQAGAAVEVWQAPPDEAGSYQEPRILVSDATVVLVSRDGAALGGSSTSIELVIDRAVVADVLGAVARDAAISVVPLAGPGS